MIATPPCQGMSVANHKKKEQEIIRNSLVVESIKIIKKVRPRFFVLENVPAFMKTICTDIDGVNKPISEAIQNNLGGFYSYIAQLINFKNYGACSSRQRTVVIGVANDYADEISPMELFPDFVEEKTLRDVELDLVDIDADNMEVLNAILGKYNIPENIKIRYIVDDFLLHSFEEMYDYVIGNLPFFKMKSSDKLLSKYKEAAINKETTNICSFFLDKAELIGNYVMLVFPKFLLNTPEFEETRTYISKKAVECIIDFGEKGFPGVLIETIAIFINNMAKPNKTRVFSYPRQIRLLQKQKYILDNKLPYWIIYRNEKFDEELKKLKFDVFTVFRDRQIKNRV